MDRCLHDPYISHAVIAMKDCRGNDRQLKCSNACLSSGGHWRNAQAASAASSRGSSAVVRLAAATKRAIHHQQHTQHHQQARRGECPNANTSHPCSPPSLIGTPSTLTRAQRADLYRTRSHAQESSFHRNSGHAGTRVIRQRSARIHTRS
ncbi:hypothetical protein EYR27_14080 [Xanthomonas oryzae]|nr:hypothetical protein EYR27_14080 [Xanthomonas oryzae]